MPATRSRVSPDSCIVQQIPAKFWFPGRSEGLRVKEQNKEKNKEQIAMRRFPCRREAPFLHSATRKGHEHAKMNRNMIEMKEIRKDFKNLLHN